MDSLSSLAVCGGSSYGYDVMDGCAASCTSVRRTVPRSLASSSDEEFSWRARFAAAGRGWPSYGHASVNDGRQRQGDSSFSREHLIRGARRGVLAGVGADGDSGGERGRGGLTKRRTGAGAERDSRASILFGAPAPARRTGS